MKDKLKKIVKKINNVFITIVLLIFYFVGIGLTFLIYRLFIQKRNNQDTYWEDAPDKKLEAGYFYSPY